MPVGDARAPLGVWLPPRGVRPPLPRGVLGSGGRGDAIMEELIDSSSDDTSLSFRSSRRKDFSDTPNSRGVRPVSSRGVFLSPRKDSKFRRVTSTLRWHRLTTLQPILMAAFT